MSWTTSYYINDFLFYFQDERQGKGAVIIDPANHQLDNPEYIDALKLACAAYPAINALHRLEEISTTSDLHLIPFHYIQQYWLTLERDTYIEIPEDIADFVEKVRTGWFVRELQDTKWRQSNTSSKSSRTIQGGWVYLIKQVNGEHYKIGRSSSPEKRIKSMGVKLPFPIEPICLIQTDDMAGLEMSLHDEFDHKRIDGEWFVLDHNDVDYLKSLAEVE